MSELDVLIKDVYIIDGTDKEPYKGSIGVQNYKVAKLGNINGDAVKVIDAQGLYASPGWIDAHSHGDSTILFFPKTARARIQMQNQA